MFLMDILLQLKKQIGRAVCVLPFDIFNGCSTSIKEIDKAMCVILFHVFNGCSTSIKEINRLIWKEMSNMYY